MKSTSLKQKDLIVKGKRKPTLVKSPSAPKRFKSSYMHFFLSVRPKVKKEMGDDVKVSSYVEVDSTFMCECNCISHVSS